MPRDRPTAWRGLADFAKRRRWMLRVADRLGRGRGRWRVLDRLARPPRPRTPDLTGWSDHALAAAPLGHATVLLRLGRRTILTDPVFSARIGLGAGLATLGPARRLAPALPLRALPRPDLILISHAHFDHLDRPTLARLPRAATVVAAAGTADLLDDLGFARVIELPWGASHRVDGVRVSAVPVVHWGARTFHDEARGCCAFLLEADGRRALFGGDTADHDGFAAVGPVDLAMLGISAYDPYLAAHATPEQAWRMACAMPAARLMPIHHGVFRLSHEPMDEPLRRLRAVADGRLVAPCPGDLWVAGANA